MRTVTAHLARTSERELASWRTGTEREP